MSAEHMLPLVGTGTRELSTSFADPLLGKASGVSVLEPPAAAPWGQPTPEPRAAYDDDMDDDESYFLERDDDDDDDDDFDDDFDSDDEELGDPPDSDDDSDEL